MEARAQTGTTRSRPTAQGRRAGAGACGRQTHTFDVPWFIIAPIMTLKSVPTLVPSGPQMLMHRASSEARLGGWGRGGRALEEIWAV